MSSTMDGSKLKKLTISGAAFSNVSETCVSASLDVSTSSVSQMKFVFNDTPSMQLFRSGSLKRGTTIRYGTWSVTIDDVGTKSGPAGPQVTVTALSSFVTKLRKQTGAKNWGNQDVSAWVRSQAKAVGMTSYWIQPGLGKRQIMREKPEGSRRESTWDVMTALARELGVWLFEYGGRLVFARPTWMMGQSGRSTWQLTWNSWSDYSASMNGLPKYNGGSEGRKDERLEVGLVAANGDTVRPGDEIALGGNVGEMGGRWIVVSCSYPMTVSETVKVVCERPVNPEKQAKAGAKKTASTKRKEAKGTTKKKTTTKSKSSSSSSSSTKQKTSQSLEGSLWFRRWVVNKHGGKWGVEGYGVQCVGLTKQYARDLFGVWPRGNGNQWYGGSVQRRYFTPISKHSTARAGDIACWGAPYGKIGGRYYGHVAVVIRDNGSTVYCLSQSGTRGLGAHYATFNKVGLQGYLRPKGQTARNQLK
ncbi:CHAP domain-containing protein [Glutamicibacter sp. AGC13]